MKIPEGSQAAGRLKLKGLGVPRLHGSGRGDLFVHLDVHVPSKLTRDQRKLFEQLRDLLPAENEPAKRASSTKSKITSSKERIMRNRLIVPILLLAMTIGVFWKLVLTRQYTYFDSPDLTYQDAGWFQVQASAWHHGQIPLLWDPYLAGGQSLIGQMQPAPAYPLNWLLFMMSLRGGFIRLSNLNWYFVLIHFMAALAAYALCRDLGRSRTASVFGAAAFAFGGYVATTAWPRMLHPTVWAPLALMFSLRAIRGEKPIRNSLLSGLFLGVQWIGGHHQIPVFTLLAITGLWIFHIARGDRIRRVGLYLALVIMMVGTGAVQMFPAFSYGHGAVRWVNASHEVQWDQPVPYSVHDEYSQPPSVLLGVFINGIYQNSNPFVGIVVFFLAIAGVWLTWKTPEVRLLACMAAGGLIFSFSSATIFHGLLYALVPFVEKARTPAMAMFIFHLGICPLAAFGLDALSTAPATWLKRAAIAVGGFTLFLWLFVFVTSVSKTEWNIRTGEVALTAFIAILLTGLLAVMPKGAPVLLIVLMMLELGGLAGRNWQNRDIGWRYWPVLARDLDVAQFLRSQPGLFRVDVKEEDVPYNFGDWYGIETFFGYVASAPASFIRMIGEPRERQLLGVQYYLAKAPAQAGQREVFSGDGGIKVFETPGAMPRAWTVHQAVRVSDPKLIHATLNSIDLNQAAFFFEQSPPPFETCSGDRALVLLHEPEFTSVEVDMNCRGMLVVGDAFSKDWIATVDGNWVPLWTPYSILRGVVVDRGNHKIELRYRPLSVYFGAALTAMSLLFGLALWRLNR